MADSNGITNFTKNQRKARAHNRFKQYICKFSDARSAERRYNIVWNSLVQFEQQMNNMPVVVETLQETKTFWENFNNSVSVIIPPSASNVTFSLAMTKGFKHFHIQYNLEIKKLIYDKRDALAAQYAAEATLGMLHANQKDDESPPIESVISPIEMHKDEANEFSSIKPIHALYMSMRRAHHRVLHSLLAFLQIAALLQAERILRSALERALIVEEVQKPQLRIEETD
ncbi:PREDICTED: microtubule-associated [Prunus dulcis]|uniref:PREDICTED: microtubule-associated n=1 Tax=Prunus dulcis TaxID=3755 RepID=A0A5E4FT71_PRUDU|nr:PREDICTED: microtubule-associated [Prunus dulcis]